MSKVSLAYLGPALVLAVACTGIKPAHATVPAHAPGQHLVVTDLVVEPSFVLSGTMIDIRAQVTNAGDKVVRRLQIGTAIAEDSGIGSVQWSDSRSAQPSPVSELAPGETVRFERQVRVSGNGWIRLGVAGRSSETMIFPAGTRVRVVDPLVFAGDVAVVLGVVAAMLGVVAVLIAWMRRQSLRTPTRPAILSRMLLAVIPIMAWAQLPEVGRAHPELVEPIAFGAAAGFGLYWYGVTSLFMSSRRAALLLSSATYAVVGAGWGLTLPLLTGRLPTQVLSDLSNLEAGAVWPFQLAQALLRIRFG